MRQLLSDLNMPTVIARINDGLEMKTNDCISIEKRGNENDRLQESKGYLWSNSVDMK